MWWFFFLFIAVEGLDIELKHGWTVQGYHNSYEVKVKDVVMPNNVHRVLEEDGRVGSVLHSDNENSLRWIGEQNWTFSNSFEVTPEFMRHDFVYLTFHGIDTVATVRVNGVKVLETDNMFTRYTYLMRGLRPYEQISVSVEFQSPTRYALTLAQKSGLDYPPIHNQWNDGDCCVNMIRKVQSSFGWDSMPSVPTIGLWKPVVLELYNTVIIRDVGYTLGEDMKDWYVNFQVHMELGTGGPWKRYGKLSIEFLSIKGFQYRTEKCLMVLPDDAGEFMESIVMIIPKSAVDKWWPRSYGGQKLYSVLVHFEDSLVYPPNYVRESHKLIKVAFRTANVYTPRIDPYGNAFYFSVNDVDIFIRGANYIPLDVFPEKTYDKDRLKQIFHAVVDGNMNMLRVWGGGYYESDEFYNLADENGILVWQDAMFPPATYPTEISFKKCVERELRQNVRRLQRHPSLVVYALNSEVEAALVDNRFLTYGKFEYYKEKYIHLFRDVVKPAISQNDYWRKIILTTPGYGYEVSYDPEEFFSGTPTNANYGDVHFLSRSSSWNLWDYTFYTKARFISEFGYQSLSSKAAWDRVLDSSDTIQKLNEKRQRTKNGHMYITVLLEMNLPPLNKNHKNYWEHFIYFSQISQAMQMKAQMITYRVERGRPENNYTMGALIWHLNDVWTGPTSSILEANGNYKIAWYYFREIFSDETVIGMINNGKLEVFIINDTPEQNTYYVVIKIYKKNSLEPIEENSFYCAIPTETVYLAETIDVQTLISSEGYGIQLKDVFIELCLFKNGNYDPIATDFEFFSFFRDTSNIAKPKLQFQIVQQVCFDSVAGIKLVSIEIMISAPAFFVYLEYLNPKIPEYTFSKNGFTQVEPIMIVHLKFEDNEKDCPTKVKNSDIRVKDLMNFS